MKKTIVFILQEMLLIYWKKKIKENGFHSRHNRGVYYRIINEKNENIPFFRPLCVRSYISPIYVRDSSDLGFWHTDLHTKIKFVIS